MHPIEAALVPLGRAFRNRRSGDADSLAGTPQLTTATRFGLTSTAFADGEVIPAKHCGPLIGPNVSPELTWGALPEGTVDLVLLIEDIDGPGPVPRIHTIAAFAPAAGGLPEGALTPGAPGIRFLPRRRGGRGGYAGPRPLPGHGPHRYRFHLYALDAEVDLAALADPQELPAALDGHVLGAGTLVGTRTS